MECPPRRTVVAVRPGPALAARRRLFGALEEAFPVSFVAWVEGGASAEAVIELAADGHVAGLEELRADRLPTLAIGGSAERESPPQDVDLASHDAIDRRVRGIRLRERLIAPLPTPAHSELVLAASREGPVWTVSREGVPVHRVRAVLPELSAGELVYSLLSRRAVVMVALLHFLRALPAVSAGHRPPPLRASILFDDPNLRWRSYGFIDYRRLLAHADEHRYHAAMAMIPLDAGRAHRPTVSLYAGRPDRLSLVFHGNDHIRSELLAVDDLRAALPIAAQAVRRMAAFERRFGLQIDRVMTPPHGLCSQAMARALGAAGFDALCAIHPHPWTAEQPTEPPLASWRPAEFVAGCAVMPRVPVTSSDADLALRAFLDHPIVVYGHHEDLAGGLDVLADIAARINRLGDVRWSSVGAIARSNYSLDIDGDVAVVAPYSRGLRLVVPEGVRAVTVSAPAESLPSSPLVGWTTAAAGPRRFGAFVPVEAGGVLDVRLVGADDVDPEAVTLPAWTPWPPIRRAFTEARDRALPLRASSRSDGRTSPSGWSQRPLTSAGRRDDAPRGCP